MSSRTRSRCDEIALFRQARPLGRSHHESETKCCVPERRIAVSWRHFSLCGAFSGAAGELG